MESSIKKHQKNVSTILHLATFSKYFFPFGNFIIPIILWTSSKTQSEFVDYNGKQVLNFQISILLYSVLIGALAIPFFLFSAYNFIGLFDVTAYNTHNLHFNFSDFFSFRQGWVYLTIAGMLALSLFMLDVFCTISAAIKTNEGSYYKYPFTIQFIK